MFIQRMIDEFVELTSISSPSRDERRMADALKKKLLALGCEVREDTAAEKIPGTAGNVLGRLPGTVGVPVLLSAHMDRVPNGDNIRPVIGEEKITSDGTTILAADDVSGIVAILEGLRQVRESGLPHCDVEVVFTACEERLATGGKHLDYDLIRAKHAYCFDSPGHIGRIINAAPGKVQFFVDVYGKSAHAGNVPEEGVNALKAAAKILADIEEGRLDYETTANWALITAGKVTNLVCDHVEIGGEARSRDPKKLDAYVEYVKRHCAEVISTTQATCTVRVEHCFDGFKIPAEDEVVSTLCSVMEGSGIQPRIEGGGGGMDANRFNARGITSVGVATGYFKNHSTQEELYLADFRQAGRLVYDLIMAYSRKEGTA